MDVIEGLDVAAMLADAPLLVIVFLLWVRPWTRRMERELRSLRRAVERAGIPVDEPDDDDDEPTPVLGVRTRRAKRADDEPSGVH